MVAKVHMRNVAHVVLILRELFDYLRDFRKLPDSRSGRDEPCRDGFGHHTAVQHFCKDRRGRVAEQCAMSTALEQGFTFQGASTKVIDKNIGVDEHVAPVPYVSQAHIPALCLRRPSAAFSDRE